MTEGRPTGLNAVVTGGNSGIGLAMAVGLARAVASVAVWGRDEGRNGQAVEQIEAVRATGAGGALRRGGRGAGRGRDGPHGGGAGAARLLVANAGVAGSTPFVEASVDDWHQILRTNLDGAFLTTREAARRFVAQGEGGSIIVVSSMVSRFGASRQAAYATSKTGLLGLGRTLAVELARHRVRCNVLFPGWTRTPHDGRAGRG